MTLFTDPKRRKTPDEYAYAYRPGAPHDCLYAPLSMPYGSGLEIDALPNNLICAVEGCTETAVVYLVDADWQVCRKHYGRALGQDRKGAKRQ